MSGHFSSSYNKPMEDVIEECVCLILPVLNTGLSGSLLYKSPNLSISNDTGYQYSFVLLLLPSDRISVLLLNWNCCLRGNIPRVPTAPEMEQTVLPIVISNVQRRTRC